MAETNEGGRRRTVLVTGASAGIGAAFVRVFAAHGFDVVLTARREDRLRALAAEVHERHGTTASIVAADLSDASAPARIEAELATSGVIVDALVNNAGYGVAGTYARTSWEQQTRFLQVLVLAVAELSHRFLPGMMARGYGRIINVASLAGLIPGTAGHTLYAAAKAFVIRMSESLALEGAGRNVHVTALCPGFVHTEFHDVTGTRDLVNRLPRVAWLDADTVARAGYDAVMRGKIVSVPGRLNRAIALAARYLPQRVFTAAAKTQASKYRRE